MSLVVSAPVLKQEENTGTKFVADKPFSLRCESVTFPDGSELTPEKAGQFGYITFRQLSSGDVEAWDEQQKSWIPETNLPAPGTLAYMDNVWQTVLVAIGQKDQAGQDKFATDKSTGYPKYFARCYFNATDSTGAEQQGTSPNSQAVEIAAVGENNRAGLAINSEDPADATEVRVYLKDAALTAEKGVVAIREQGSGLEIALNNSTAVITLTNDGDILLTPALSRSVQINGDLTVNGNVNIQGTLSVNGVVLTVP